MSGLRFAEQEGIQSFAIPHCDERSYARREKHQLDRIPICAGKGAEHPKGDRTRLWVVGDIGKKSRAAAKKSVHSNSGKEHRSDGNFASDCRKAINDHRCNKTAHKRKNRQHKWTDKRIRYPHKIRSQYEDKRRTECCSGRSSDQPRLDDRPDSDGRRQAGSCADAVFDGATHSVQELNVTSISAAEYTLVVHKRAFEEHGLAEVWPRVIALVVQPGVEFDHDAVVAYNRAKAKPLTDWLHVQREEIVFEAHSTDYQLPNAYAELVEDGFAILKVGPALTFAMREALCALEDMESQLIAETRRSFLTRVIEETMLREPASWKPYYGGSPAEQKLLRLYSYSDRIRYYWHRPEIAEAIDTLISNMSAVAIPESMCSRYLPTQYERLRKNEIAGDPVSLIVDRIRDVLRVYAAACSQGAGL